VAGAAARDLQYLEPHRFKKGQSGNPNGRRPGVATAARAIVGNDPKQLVRILFDVAQNENAKDVDRLAAVREILDRGWGKAPSHSLIEDGDPLELDDVDRAVRAVVDELAEKREAEAARRSA
jgi:hypothetical protein